MRDEGRNMKTVTLNEQEAGLVLGAIDAAVRAGGTRAAVVLVPVAIEIERQLQAAGKPEGGGTET